MERASAALRLWEEPSCLVVHEGCVRVDALVQLPAVLRGLGLDPDATIAAAGLAPGTFGDPDNAIAMADLGRLLALAVARSGCEHVGLLVGEHTRLASLGLVGLLTKHAPDVGTALRDLGLHLQLRDRAGVAPLLASNGLATFGYEIYAPQVEGVDQICDGALAMAMNFMRELCGPSWRPLRVLFAHSRPGNLRPFRRYFEAPLHFDAERNALVFPSQWLAQRIRGADPELHRDLGARVAALESGIDGDLVAELRRMLRVILLSGRGSVAEVAARLSMHRRTLNRRLRARGTSLHRLVEEGRSEIALQLVARTRMPLTEVATTLGYADASAFTRAFRRWTGVAPSAWRRLPPGRPRKLQLPSRLR